MAQTVMAMTLAAGLWALPSQAQQSDFDAMAVPQPMEAPGGLQSPPSGQAPAMGQVPQPFAAEGLVPSAPELAPSETADLLAPPDQGFLLSMEAWQRRIALLTLALRASELEVRRAEQEKRLRELQVETDSIDILGLGGFGDDGALGSLPPMLQGSIGSLEGLRAAQNQARNEPARAPDTMVAVQQIRGVADNLVATVATVDGDVVQVREGDMLPDGRPVVRVSSGAVTIQQPSGRNMTYGLATGRF